MATRRGRPPHPEPVTPAEARVLELVREGMPNAEIAVRLGLSVNTVKYHVSNLLAKAGVTERGELRDARLDAKPRTRRWRGFLPALPLWLKLAGGAVTATVVGLAAVSYFASDSGPTDDSFTTGNVPIPAGYERPTAAELTARGMLDAGPFFISPNAVAGIQIRGDMTVVQGNPGAIVVVGPSGSVWSIASSGGGQNVAELHATGRVRGALYDLTIGGWWYGELKSDYSGPQHQTVGRFELLPSATHGAPAELVVEAGQANDGPRHSVAVASNGHLFIAEEAIPDTLVTDYATGQTLDTSHARRLGGVSNAPGQTAYAITRCETGICYGVWSADDARGVLAPMDGGLACTDDALSLSPIGLAADDVSITFTNLLGSSCLNANTPVYHMGDPIAGAGLWKIGAYRGHDNSFVSVGLDRSGTVYLGVAPATLPCPCRPSN